MGGDADWRREKMRSRGDGWTKLSPGSVGGWGAGGVSRGSINLGRPFVGATETISCWRVSESIQKVRLLSRPSLTD